MQVESTVLSTRRIEQARAMLAEARSLIEVKETLDQMLALREYTKQRDDAAAAHADAWAIGQLAMRRLGEMTRELPKAKPGPKAAEVVTTEPELGNGELHNSDAKPKRQVLKEISVTPMQASRYERIAGIPDDEFSKRLTKGRDRIVRDQERGKGMTGTSEASDYDSDGWGTPERYMEMVRAVIGPIDLDPASNAGAANIVKAAHFYTNEDSGLVRSWKCGSLYLNSPFSTALVQAFTDRFLSQWEEQQFERAIRLTNASTETAWYQSMLGACNLACLPDHRIAFLDANGNLVKGNRYAQTFFYFGPDESKFIGVFGQIGKIVKPINGFF